MSYDEELLKCNQSSTYFIENFLRVGTEEYESTNVMLDTAKIELIDVME